jgi:hypothetical protein
MNKILLLILIIPCLISCSTSAPLIPEKTWNNLDVYSEKWDNAKDEIDIIVKSKDNRIVLYDFIISRLDSFYLSFREQLKLSSLLYDLQQYAESNEYIIINDIIKKGHSHPTFYYYALSESPEYIETSLEVLKDKYDRKAKLFNPDGGYTKKVYLQKDFIEILKSTTGLEFGCDYNAWTNWWHVEGKYLPYNYISRQYAKSKKF